MEDYEKEYNLLLKSFLEYEYEYDYFYFNQYSMYDCECCLHVQCIIWYIFYIFEYGEYEDRFF